MPPFGEPEVALGDVIDVGVNWEITIDSSVALLADYQRFTVVRLSPKQPLWKIVLTAIETEKSSALPTASNDKEVGQLMLRDKSIILRAQEPRSVPEVTQLRNCILHFRSGDSHRAVLLRSPKQVDEVVLDLEKGAIRIPLDIDAVPRTDRLVLEIANITNFGDEVTGPKTAKSRYLQPEPAEIAFPIDIPCGIKAELVGVRSEPTVKLTPYYRILDSDYDLTTRQFRATLASLTREFKESVGKEAAYKERLDRIPGEISRLRSIQPRSNVEGDMVVRQINKLLDEQKKLPIVIRGILE